MFSSCSRFVSWYKCIMGNPQKWKNFRGCRDELVKKGWRQGRDGWCHDQHKKLTREEVNWWKKDGDKVMSCPWTTDLICKPLPTATLHNNPYMWHCTAHAFAVQCAVVYCIGLIDHVLHIPSQLRVGIEIYIICTQCVDGWRSGSIFGGIYHVPPFTFLKVKIKAS